MNGAEAREKIARVRAAVHQAVVGRDEALEQIATGLVADLEAI